VLGVCIGESLQIVCMASEKQLRLAQAKLAAQPRDAKAESKMLERALAALYLIAHAPRTWDAEWSVECATRVMSSSTQDSILEVSRISPA
jgi:hypothetical protein